MREEVEVGVEEVPPHPITSTMLLATWTEQWPLRPGFRVKDSLVEVEEVEVEVEVTSSVVVGEKMPPRRRRPRGVTAEVCSVLVGEGFISYHTIQSSSIPYHTIPYHTELKKVAILANQVRGTLLESGEHFDQIFTLSCKILEYVAIYTLLLPFSCLM